MPLELRLPRRAGLAVELDALAGTGGDLEVLQAEAFHATCDNRRVPRHRSGEVPKHDVAQRRRRVAHDVDGAPFLNYDFLCVIDHFFLSFFCFLTFLCEPLNQIFLKFKKKICREIKTSLTMI